MNNLFQKVDYCGWFQWVAVDYSELLWISGLWIAENSMVQWISGLWISGLWIAVDFSGLQISGFEHLRFADQWMKNESKNP
jgi:hypothetical protein